MTALDHPSELRAKGDFLRTFNIAEETFRRTRFSWKELEHIYSDYLKWYPLLILESSHLAASLQTNPLVRTVSFRAKHPEHLIEKLIRKSATGGNRYATFKNYLMVFPDLVGFRALYVFKEDWGQIDEFIRATFDLVGRPEAKVTLDDSKNVLKMYRNKGCALKCTDDYRSVHYAIRFRCKKLSFVAELQVRTLFEEAWGEVSHKVNYPLKLQNELFDQCFRYFSNSASFCDDLASTARMLHEVLKLNSNGRVPGTAKNDVLLTRLIRQLEFLKSKWPEGPTMPRHPKWD